MKADKIDALRALAAQSTRDAEERARAIELRRQRAEVIQRALDLGCTYTEIAYTLGITESAVRKALSNAKALLSSTAA